MIRHSLPTIGRAAACRRRPETFSGWQKNKDKGDKSGNKAGAIASSLTTGGTNCLYECILGVDVGQIKPLQAKATLYQVHMSINQALHGKIDSLMQRVQLKTRSYSADAVMIRQHMRSLQHAA